MIRRLVTAAVAVALGCVGLSGCGSSDDGTITVGMAAPNMSANWVPLAVAQERGFFAAEGLRVNIEYQQTSDGVLKAMAVGRTQIGASVPEAVFPALDHSQRLTMIYNWCRKPVAMLAVQRDSKVRTIADLRGATIGAQSLAAGPVQLAKASLAQAGLDPAKDVKFVAVGTGASAQNALETGRVGALMLYDSLYSPMEQAGAKLRYLEAKSVDDLFATTFAVDPAWLATHREQVAGFGRAFTKAQVWARANPKAAVELMWRGFPLSKVTPFRDKEMQTQLGMYTARSRSTDLANATPGQRWGEYEPSALRHWQGFTKEQGLVKKEIPLQDVYTNEFVSAYNDFDVDQVVRDAQNFRL
ncbi:ABC transporter substrate-binding protein [Pseudonocardia acaciae]|uniref:ABC transporter substrate-binding protein n=1 Tax=Pseudonocardia acaciae TaxID=551276 RepID=UPI0006841165|nr:ABC transporter substrate-binding protein [Pseudonocardia acaciae]